MLHQSPRSDYLLKNSRITCAKSQLLLEPLLTLQTIYGIYNVVKSEK